MKAHLLPLCLLAALSLAGCATTVSPLFPTTRASVAPIAEPQESAQQVRTLRMELPVKGAVANGMACRGE